MKRVSQVIDKRYTGFSFKGFIGTLSGIIQLLMTSILVFGVLSYSRILGTTASLTIIYPRKVSAELFVSPLALLPTDFQTVIDISVIILLTIMIILIIKITFWRKHYITTNFGRARPRNGNQNSWTIIINVIHTRINFCSEVTENIYLRVPCTLFNGRQIRDLRIVNCCFTWVIVRNGDSNYFKLSEDVHLYSLDKDGNRDNNDWQRIRFKVDEIQYNYEPFPSAFKNANNYGMAFISLARDNASFK